MATLTVQINSALGTNTSTLTFSATDAQRIFAAWQNKTNNAGGTQAQFAAWLASQIQSQLIGYVGQNEQAAVIPPAITATTS